MVPANGGGVYVYGGKLNLSGNAVIKENEASGIGGGAEVTGNGTLSISGNAVITANKAGGYGGGVYAMNSVVNISESPAITANMLTGSSNPHGGGMYFGGKTSSLTVSGSPVIQNNTKADGSPNNLEIANVMNIGGDLSGAKIGLSDNSSAGEFDKGFTSGLKTNNPSLTDPSDIFTSDKGDFVWWTDNGQEARFYTAYSITLEVNDESKGTASAPSAQREGQPVSVTVTPAENCVLAEPLKAEYTDPETGNLVQIELTQDGDVWSFDMVPYDVTIPVSFADAVAQITRGEGSAAVTTKYTTLAKTVEGAVNGDTILMIADHKLPDDVTIDKNVTLDLNGKTITADDGDITISYGSTVTITSGVDGGKILSESFCPVYNYGELTVSGGTIESKASYAILNEGTLTITGGTIRSSVETAIINDTKNAVVTISGNAELSGKTGIEIYDGTLNLKGGTVSGHCRNRH